MSGGKETFAGNLLALLPDADNDRWRKWIGSVAWDRIKRAERVIIARAACAAPSALDEDDLRLRQAVSAAWTTLLLANADLGDDPPWVLSGAAAGAERGALIRSIRSATKLDGRVLPFYRHQSRRHLALRAEALGAYWAAHGRRDESWFSRWVEADDLLARRTPLPRTLALSLLSHESAWTRRFLEFSIPEFVRAAEGVLALEKHMGQQVFQERALRLVPDLRTDAYVGAEVEALLLDLYKLRSACVHGKVPFLGMQDRGEEGVEHAARLAYVAEVLAREALLAALRHPEQGIFTTRETLEGAWASGSFPAGSARSDAHSRQGETRRARCPWPESDRLT